MIVLRSLPPQKRPVWHQWCNKDELSGCLDRLLAAQKHVDTILRIEKAISIEIQELARLGIFPSFEITMIRKDMKRFKELEEMRDNGEIDRDEGGVVEARLMLKQLKWIYVKENFLCCELERKMN